MVVKCVVKAAGVWGEPPPAQCRWLPLLAGINRAGAAGGVEILPGGDLFSHFVAKAVSSALGRFTTVFGMGTGGATPLKPPGSKSNGKEYALFFTIWQGVKGRIWKIDKIPIWGRRKLPVFPGILGRIPANAGPFPALFDDPDGRPPSVHLDRPPFPFILNSVEGWADRGGKAGCQRIRSSCPTPTTRPNTATETSSVGRCSARR